MTQQDLPLGLIPKVAHAHAKADGLVKKLQERKKTPSILQLGNFDRKLQLRTNIDG